MTDDVRRLVLSGYDDVADAYFDRFGVSAVRRRWLDRLVGRLPRSGGRVLDLGCGNGLPVARDLAAAGHRDLAAAGHRVVGVDGSMQQVIRARRNVPAAAFVRADMCTVGFASGSFDAVCAFYAIAHVPPERQRPLIASIAAWLRPGGTLVASFGAGPAGGWTGDWLGARMVFGHAGEATTLGSQTAAGLRVRRSAVELQDGEAAAFLWVEAIERQDRPLASSRSDGEAGPGAPHVPASRIDT